MNNINFCPERDGFVSVDPYKLTDLNPFSKIGKEWMLITAADTKNGVNAMTASWGGVGSLWNKPVVFCFVRPQRYTFGLTQEQENISICFLGEKYHATHRIFGFESGRDVDKIKKTGLTAEFVDGVPVIIESELILTCRKLYADYLKDDGFIDIAVRDKCYPEKDYHMMYVYEITGVYAKAQS